MDVERRRSMAEFWECNPNPVNCHPEECARRSASEREDWLGMSYQEVLGLPTKGWEEGIKMAERLLKAKPEANKGGLKRTWEWEDGVEFRPDRHYEEQKPWESFKRTPLKSGSRVVKLLVCPDGNAGVSPQELVWIVFAAVKAVHDLEAQGLRVEVEVVFTFANIFLQNANTLVERVLAKPAHAPLDLSQLAAVVSPAAMRFYSFLHACEEPEPISSGFGSSDFGKVRELAKEGDLTLTLREVYDESSANAWLAKISD